MVESIERMIIADMSSTTEMTALTSTMRDTWLSAAHVDATIAICSAVRDTNDDNRDRVVERTIERYIRAI
jgi:hypothetical protein